NPSAPISPYSRSYSRATPLVAHAYASAMDDAKCDFFMWCDEVQNFVDSQITCGKDENMKTLEYRVAKLEDDRKDLNCIVNKTKMVVKVLPEAFSYLNIVDGDDWSESE
ncbi:hypothetical protein Taro_051642, partial [Colocasia esculenta]|nr:hypothetical protein [Colocasia esculenta]